MQPLASNGMEKLYRAIACAGFGTAWAALRLTGSATADLRSRSGHVPPAEAPVLWFHGASAGEMAAAVQLAGLLRNDGFSFTAAYTAANPAGVKLAAARGKEGDVATLAPWDVSRWVERSFDVWQPKALFLVEGELWPSLTREAARRCVPLFCVSARIYRRDLWGYKVIRSLMQPMLQRMTAILAADDVERQRFIDLGAPAQRCFVAGNLKYLASTHPTDPNSLDQILDGAERDRLVVCGSIHADEVHGLFTTLDALPRDVRVVIATRHAKATSVIGQECRRRCWSMSVRSAGRADDAWRVLVLDSVGELARAYGFGCVAVVGGGFQRHGGHNPFEAVSEGTPVLLGRHFDHFAKEATALTSACPESVVTDFAELAVRLRSWLDEPARRIRALSLQQGAVPDSRQIADRYGTVLHPWLRRQGIPHVLQANGKVP